MEPCRLGYKVNELFYGILHCEVNGPELDFYTQPCISENLVEKMSHQGKRGAGTRELREVEHCVVGVICGLISIYITGFCTRR